MLMKPLLHALLLALPLAPCIAAEQPDLSRWTEDFSDPAAFTARWHSYGWLPDGKTVSGPKNMHRWWNIEEGVLKGQTFGKLHPSGLQRKVTGTDVRLSARFKLSEGGMAAVGFNGPNPILEANFHLAGVHIRQNVIRAWDEENLYPKGSPEAEALKKEKKMNRKFIGAAKTEKIDLAVDAWHDLVLEMRGRTITARIDGKEVLSYVTNAGDAPKDTVQFSVGGNGSEVTNGWYANVRFEPLTP
ncbi:MAG: hypothetical protein RLZZ244_555 [Verrucomicrobiota bacterium]|jgi:hypothetical protein